MGLLKTARRLLLGLLRANQSRALGSAWLSSVLALTAAPGPLLRRFTDEVQPAEPIRATGLLPPVEIVIASSRKDFDILPTTVRLGLLNVSNPVGSVTIVVPDGDVQHAPRLDASAVVVGENALLPKALVEAVRQHHPPRRYGWVLQQVLGLYFAWSSEYSGVIVLDADTLLTRPRAFLGRDKKQILSLSSEYFEPYEDHATKVWGLRRRLHGLSYVTHHQLTQPWVLQKMFPRVEDLAEWVWKAAIDHNAPLSEYHSYGRWLCDHYPEYVSLARWGNKAVARSSFDSLEPEILVREIARRFPDYLSVSLHSYLR